LKVSLPFEGILPEDEVAVGETLEAPFTVEQGFVGGGIPSAFHASQII